MGKPKKVEPVNIDTNYNWGSFGSANKYGARLNPTATGTVNSVQGGIRQYLDELIDPTYSSESFNARQALLDSESNQYAKNLSANAMERNARGSGLMSALNNVMANRNKGLYNAMGQEDSRIRSVLNSLAGIESNYFNQANTMANNILQRQLTNAERATLANATNVGNYNAWKNNLLSGGAQIGGTALGAYLSKDNSPYTFVNNMGGTSTVVPGGYTEIDLNTMQPK